MKNFLVRIIIALVLLFPLVFLVPHAMAQDPTVEPILEPIPALPDTPPPLPDQLPENPMDLAPLLDWLILWGAGLAAAWLTDVAKVIPGVGNNPIFRKQIVRAVAAAATVLVTFVGYWFGILADFLYSNGIWAAILALFSVTFVAHRSDKLLRQIGSRLIKRLHT